MASVIGALTGINGKNRIRPTLQMSLAAIASRLERTDENANIGDWR